MRVQRSRFEALVRLYFETIFGMRLAFKPGLRLNNLSRRSPIVDFCSSRVFAFFDVRTLSLAEESMLNPPPCLRRIVESRAFFS